jgi:signal transduction histidine kinase
MGRYVRHRLHRRLFAWFAATILITALIAALSSGAGRGWAEERARVERLVGHTFASSWDDPERRDALAAEVAHDLELGVVLKDRAGEVIGRFGPNGCSDWGRFQVPIRRGGRGEPLGTAEVCVERYQHGHWHGLLPLAVVVFVLWAASGKIARRLARPLADLARVAHEIGAGRLSARAELGCQDPDEVGILAEAVNDMAGRIQRQLEDQRALLAAVSHELRTPLGHLRLLVEMARTSPSEGKVFDEFEKEIVEIDALVGELLAGSRLDFTALDRRPLDARDVARRALERSGVTATALSVEARSTEFEGDPTLVARALANLIENAKKHGGGVSALRVRDARPGFLAFEVDDAGSGFAETELERVFVPFYHPKDGAAAESEPSPKGLGLGLSLVKRIAEAHGGTAYARNRPEGGAQVGIELRAEPPLAAAQSA